MPRITKVETMDDISKIDNPLFFGVFANYDQEDYLEHVSDNIICNDSARRFLAKDIYQGGLVLATKYNKLGYAYRYALIGLFLLVITFASLILA